ncbi:MAG: (d)CMP kinase [Actinomycetia bacterium]|nr:(d)CMP kinase [Actinomycetes bacterium]
MIIAIDGPAGSGKSTVARRIATQLGFHYLDTGAMYRAVTVAATRRGIPLTYEAALIHLAQTARIGFGYTPGEALPTQVLIDGADVTRAIRTPETDAGVSVVARQPQVRAALVAQQRELAAEADTVVEGRDIGTVVFPHAELKVFLTADPAVRAARRIEQNAEQDLGADQDRRSAFAALVARDEADSSREHSPLAAAVDARILDTTDLSLDEVCDQILVWAKDVRHAV